MCIFTSIEGVRKVYILLFGWLQHDIDFKLFLKISFLFFSKPFKPTLIQNLSYHRSLLTLTHLKTPLAFPETTHNGY